MRFRSASFSLLALLIFENHTSWTNPRPLVIVKKLPLAVLYIILNNRFSMWRYELLLEAEQAAIM